MRWQCTWWRAQDGVQNNVQNDIQNYVDGMMVSKMVYEIWQCKRWYRGHNGVQDGIQMLCEHGNVQDCVQETQDGKHDMPMYVIWQYTQRYTKWCTN